MNILLAACLTVEAWWDRYKRNVDTYWDHLANSTFNGKTCKKENKLTSIMFKNKYLQLRNKQILDNFWSDFRNNRQHELSLCNSNIHSSGLWHEVCVSFQRRWFALSKGIYIEDFSRNCLFPCSWSYCMNTIHFIFLFISFVYFVFFNH